MTGVDATPANTLRAFRSLAAVLALVIPQAVGAADAPDPADVAALEACVADRLPSVRDAQAECVGMNANLCMAEPDGGTTLGMAGCLRDETDAWDVLLNRDWPELMARARASDADYAEMGANVPSAEKTLRTAQRSWLAWREAECMALAAEWGDGSHRHIAWADCWLRLTGERTIALRARLQDTW